MHLNRRSGCIWRSDVLIITPVARTNQSSQTSPCSQNQDYAHRLPPVAYHKLNQLDQDNPPDPTQPYPTNHMKVHLAHDREPDYQDSLHSAKDTQLYPQVGDFIAS
jgi:hypothetical protein